MVPSSIYIEHTTFDLFLFTFSCDDIPLLGSANDNLRSVELISAKLRVSRQFRNDQFVG